MSEMAIVKKLISFTIYLALKNKLTIVNYDQIPYLEDVMSENRDNIVATRLNDHEYQILKKYCAKEHIKISEGLRLMLKQITAINSEL